MLHLDITLFVNGFVLHAIMMLSCDQGCVSQVYKPNDRFDWWMCNMVVYGIKGMIVGSVPIVHCVMGM